MLQSGVVMQGASEQSRGGGWTRATFWLARSPAALSLVPCGAAIMLYVLTRPVQPPAPGAAVATTLLLRTCPGERPRARRHISSSSILIGLPTRTLRPGL